MTTEYPIEYNHGDYKYWYIFALENQQDTFNMQSLTDVVNANISCYIYRKDQQDQQWTYTGPLNDETAIPFELIYEDGLNIQGTLTLFHSDSMEMNYVFMDAYMGLDLEEHFEGNVAAINNM